MEVGRFAPSTTGRAHAGTLLAALLCWLDARSRKAELWLRLEDLDPDRCRPQWSEGIRDDLAWLGVDFDRIVEQHDLAAQHEAALDRLAEAGLLYPCACSRSSLAEGAARAPDGSLGYPNRCRGRELARGGWRASCEPLRVRLPDSGIFLRDESGLDLSQQPASSFGDPIVRRRDGAIAYHLAVVVDDAASGVTRVVRGRDLAPSTATQVALQRLLGLPTPVYRHHLLLLEERGEKLAKLHGSAGADVLRASLAAEEVCGFLACAAGLRSAAEPTTPHDLLHDFCWEHAGSEDRVVRFEAGRLELVPAASGGGYPRSP